MKSNRRHRRRRQEGTPPRRRILRSVAASLLCLAIGGVLILVSLFASRIHYLKRERPYDAAELSLRREQYARILDHEAGEDTEEIALAEKLLANQMAKEADLYLQSDDTEHVLLRFADPQNARGATNRDLFFLMSSMASTDRTSLMYLPNTLYLKGTGTEADQLQAYASYAGIDYARRTLEQAFAVPIPKILDFDIAVLLQRFTGESAIALELSEQEAKAINLQISDRLEKQDTADTLPPPALPEEAGYYPLAPSQLLAYWRLGTIEGSPSPYERRIYLVDSLISYYSDFGFTGPDATFRSIESLTGALSTNLDFFGLLAEGSAILRRFNSEIVHFDLLTDGDYERLNYYGNDLIILYPRELQRRFHAFVEQQSRP